MRAASNVIRGGTINLSSSCLSGFERWKMLLKIEGLLPSRLFVVNITQLPHRYRRRETNGVLIFPVSFLQCILVYLVHSDQILSCVRG